MTAKRSSHPMLPGFAEVKMPDSKKRRCLWPGCEALVMPSMWGCRPHWYQLPREIRNRIWHSYRSGQELDLKISKEYAEAARAAQDWIAERKASTP